MIFSELYSAYYDAVAAILTRVLAGNACEKDLQKIVSERAFGESVLTILPALKGEKWQLLHKDLTTPITHAPTRPLTTLQKRWLKAISLDPRIRLFDMDFPVLSDVEPLFTPADFVVYDKYGDGDPFEDADYIHRFRVILGAIREGRQIQFEMLNRKGNTMLVRCRPLRLEYSEKDDKFRVITAGSRTVSTANLSKIISCTVCDGEADAQSLVPEVKSKTLIAELTDERNALERFMLHFAHFEKRAERTDERHYRIRIQYAQDDEAEMVIRILSFGPMVKVTEPEDFVNLLKKKLKKQKSCELR